MYGTRYVEVYDLLMRNRGKDYAGESAEVARVVRERNPHATSLLDVACGTGLHLQFYVELFGRAVGLDLSEDMLGLARMQIPGLTVRQGDMRDFRLEERFDAITCMFAIPHLQSATELEETVGCLVRHLAPGGVLVVEPWYSPDEFVPDYVSTDLIRDGTRTIFRVSHSVRDAGRDDRVRMVVHYVEADPASGIRHSTETLHMTLFTHEQYEKAFAAAGCAVEHLRGGSSGRGLWVTPPGIGSRER